MPCSNDQRCPCAMNEGNGKITKSRHNLRGMTRTNARTIFTKGYIAHIMGPVLNAPMTPHEGKQAGWISLMRVKIERVDTA